MKTKFLLSSIVATLFLVASTKAQNYVLTPNHDCSVGFHDFTNSADNNYGNAIYYGGFSQPGAFGGENAGMGLMSFDLSAIPEGTIITDARLDLFGCGPFGGGDAAEVGDLGHNASYLERITSSWEEYTVTWNTQPHATKEHRAHLQWSTSVDEDYIDINVTQMVQDMIDDPTHSFGIRIRVRNQTPTRALAFWSRDGAPSEDLQPQLRITVSGMKSPLVEHGRSIPQMASVFPNPFHSSAQIQLVNESDAQNAELRVYNIFGQLMLNLNVTDQSSIEIERGNLAKGFYQFAIIKENSIVEFGKFVIE